MDKIWQEMLEEGWNEDVSPLQYAKMLRHVKGWHSLQISDEEAHLTVKNIICICNIVGCKWKDD